MASLMRPLRSASDIASSLTTATIFSSGSAARTEAAGRARRAAANAARATVRNRIRRGSVMGLGSKMRAGASAVFQVQQCADPAKQAEARGCPGGQHNRDRFRFTERAHDVAKEK